MNKRFIPQKELLIENKNGIKFYLELRGNIVVVDGNSGTGKTFLCKTIKELKSVKSEDTGLSNVEVFNYESEGIEHKIKSCKHKLIIIDNADIIISQSLADFISTDVYNQYLIFSRAVKLDFHITPNYYAEMVDTGGLIRLKYRRSVEGWY